MRTRAAYRKSAKAGIVAAAATVLLGWFLLFPDDTPPLVRWSYDLCQRFLPSHHSPELDPVIVYMDEEAMQNYNQQPGQWSRAIHARLLDRLSQDGPQVVVFDVMMTQARDPAQDDELAHAIGHNRRVVLAGDRGPMTVYLGDTTHPPLRQFETNAAGWGVAKIKTEPDSVARRYFQGDDEVTSLAWAAARVAGAPVTQNPKGPLEERWLNYYGSARPFASRSMTYRDAETRERGFFTNKAVFIGGKPETLARGDITDVFATPFNERAPGVDVTAIAFANLVHDDWLRRPGRPVELAILLVTGALAGFGLQRVPLQTALWLSALLALVLAAVAITVLLSTRIWFPWVIGVAQLPCALAFRLWTARDPAFSGTPQTEYSAGTPGPHATPTVASLAPPIVQSNAVEIPDHTLIRCIGEGAYGQVWVARNAIGLYHAVKVLYRNRFGTEVPYDRAWRGIQKFMPVSRSHPGFVHILHVGRNERAGFFFYIMEAGDDQQTGQQIDPASYAPKTLASELKQRGKIPPRECLEFMLALTEAVEQLHQHQLIHRDIKPANIIFVNHRPKLADIDLVTDLSLQGEASLIGTEGYLAPEGPGTAAADVFSLGRILYVALTGKAPDQLPELPTRVSLEADYSLLLELNQISCKACEFDLARRYASAAAMHAELLAVQRRLG